MDRHPRGLTLLELMVTVALMSTVLGVGVPAFRKISEAVRVTGVLHALTTSLVMARSIAVTRGIPVAVCPSQDGVTCRRDGVWDQGWITIQAPGRGWRETRLPQEVLMHESSGGRGLVIQSNRSRIRFHPNGVSRGYNLSICVYAASGAPPIGRIAVNHAGRIRSERAPNTTICANSP